METAMMRLERRRMTIERRKKKDSPLHTCAVTPPHEKDSRSDGDSSVEPDKDEVRELFDPIPTPVGAAF
jgi:hypothetical protein